MEEQISSSIVFISYASEDSHVAERLCEDLKHAGLIPWLDKKDLIAGQNWKKQIEVAIRKSRYFIPLFSKTSVKKRGYAKKRV